MDRVTLYQKRVLSLGKPFAKRIMTAFDVKVENCEQTRCISAAPAERQDEDKL